MRFLWIILIVIALAGCSSGGSSDSNETGAASSAIDSRFVGLWDMTTVDEEYGEDVVYHYISEDGSAIDYDYIGDAFDDFYENCYVEVEGSQKYTQEGSNYRLSLDSEYQEPIDFLIRLDIVANILQATILEAVEGVVTQGQVFSIGPRLNRISVTDIENQLCSWN